jgi:hypothetical protein
MGKAKPGRRPAGKPPPKCKAILLCDQTIIEMVTRKVSVIGIFDNFVLPQFPGMTRPATAFLQLVTGIGRYEIVIEIQDLRDNRVLARAAGPGVEFPERLQKMNLMIPIPPLPLHHPGVYDVVVYANGQEIDRQQFTAVSPIAPDQGGQENE